MKVSAILLAAGLSRRMGTDKLMLEYQGKPLVQHSIDLLSKLPVYESIIVTSNARLKSIALPPGIWSIINPTPENGQSSSIRIGLEAATGTHYMFMTADQPKLTPDDIIPLLQVAKENPDKIIYPIIDNKPNSPTIFPEHFRTELLCLSGDTGGREIRDNNKKSCLALEPEHQKNFKDIDSKEDFDDLF